MKNKNEWVNLVNSGIKIKRDDYEKLKTIDVFGEKVELTDKEILESLKKGFSSSFEKRMKTYWRK